MTINLTGLAVRGQGGPVGVVLGGRTDEEVADKLSPAQSAPCLSSPQLGTQPSLGPGGGGGGGEFVPDIS